MSFLTSSGALFTVSTTCSYASFGSPFCVLRGAPFVVFSTMIVPFVLIGFVGKARRLLPLSSASVGHYGRDPRSGVFGSETSTDRQRYQENSCVLLPFATYPSTA